MLSWEPSRLTMTGEYIGVVEEAWVQVQGRVYNIIIKLYMRDDGGESDAGSRWGRRTRWRRGYGERVYAPGVFSIVNE